jgi:hypothetical protein
MNYFIQKAFAQSDFASDPSNLIVGIFGGLWLLFAIIALVFFILWIWALVDCIQKEFPGDEKTTWIIILVIAFFLGFGWLAAIIYFLMGMNHGKKADATSNESNEKKIKSEKEKK